MRLFVFLLLIFTGYFSEAQSYKGQVVHAKTGLPVPFAHIRYHENKGVISDIDGFYEFVASDVDSLKVSYVGFEAQAIKAKPDKQQTIRLRPETLELEEVVIQPGKNPALEIIRRLLKNKEQHNPVNYDSYSYRAYDKMYFTVHEDSIAAHRQRLEEDSSFMKLKRFFDKQHLFLMENITKARYNKPGKKQEEVLATRTSGFKDPLFTFLLSQMQSASFYDKRIRIGGKEFVNPLNKVSLSRYWFSMEDTLTSDLKDTTYIISFRPKRNINFEGLKGVVAVNNQGWAVENIVAEPEEKPNGGLHVKIEQNYEKTEEGYWFPSQQNTELFLGNVQAGGVPLLGRGKRYIFDVTINKQSTGSFNPSIALKYDEDAFDRENESFTKFRRIPVTEKDLETYRVIDSIGEAEQFAEKFTTLQTAYNGSLKAGPVNFPFKHILDNNRHEGWRIGAGIESNNDFSRWISLSGYFAYGLKDNAWKYGAGADVFLDRYHNHSLQYSYSDDLEENGVYNSRTFLSLINSESFRNFEIAYLNRIQRHHASFKTRPFTSLQLEPFLQKETTKPLFDYNYVSENDLKHFAFLEAGIFLRFAFREKFVRYPNREVSLGTSYPVLKLRYQRGLDEKDFGDFDYHRVYFQINHAFKTNLVGETAYRLEGGYVTEQVPVMKMFHGRGSKNSVFYSPNSFATMGYGEFYHHRFLSLYASHQFGKLLVNTRYFSPDISIHHNMQFGTNKNQGLHQNMVYAEAANGYHESGIVLNSILDLGLAGIGISAFYRHGAYALPEFKNNLSVMVGLTILGN